MWYANIIQNVLSISVWKKKHKAPLKETTVLQSILQAWDDLPHAIILCPTNFQDLYSNTPSYMV